MKRYKTMGYMILVLAATGWGSGAAMADSHMREASERGPGKAMHGQMHGGGRQGGGMHHGGSHGQGGDHGRGGLHGPRWVSTLTDAQRAKLDVLKVAHAKRQAPRKLQARAIKMELAVLATADEPDHAAMEKRITALLELKKAMLQEKYRYKAEQRKILDVNQRPSFDIQVLKSAMHSGKGRHRGH